MFIALCIFSEQKMSYHSKDFLEGIFVPLVKVQKPMEEVNATSLKRKLFYSTKFFVRILPVKLLFSGESPLPPCIIIKNIQTLIACSVYEQQAHRVLVLSVWNTCEKLFQIS